jgi:hypothetical protein
LGEDDNTEILIFDSYRYSHVPAEVAQPSRDESDPSASADVQSSNVPTEHPAQKANLRPPRLSSVSESNVSILGEGVGLFMLQTPMPSPLPPLSPLRTNLTVAPPASPVSPSRKDSNIATALRRQAEANRSLPTSPIAPTREDHRPIAASAFPLPPNSTAAERPKPEPLRHDSLYGPFEWSDASPSPTSPRRRANTSPDAEALKTVVSQPEHHHSFLRSTSQPQLVPPAASSNSRVSFDSSSRSSMDDNAQTPRRKTSLRLRAALGVRRQNSISERPDNLSKQSLFSSSSEHNGPLSPAMSSPSPTTPLFPSSARGGKNGWTTDSLQAPENGTASVVQLGNNEFELVRPNVDYATDGDGPEPNGYDSVGVETETEDEGSGPNGEALVVRPGLAARQRARLTFIAESGGLEMDEVDEYGFVHAPGEGPQGSRIHRLEPSRVNVEVHRAKEASWLSILAGGNAANVRKRKKIKRLVRSGVPSGLRGKVWVSLQRP